MRTIVHLSDLHFGRVDPALLDPLRNLIHEIAPDVVVISPCGFHLSGAIEQARQVAGRFPDAEVWAIDADGLVVRPGPRLVDGVEAIASILHPDAVAPKPGSTARIA